MLSQPLPLPPTAPHILEPPDHDTMVRRYSGWMLSIAQRYVRDRSLAEDCVQNALMCAINKIDQFEGRACFKSWLYRITTNAALVMLRARKGHDDRDIETLLPQCDAEGLRREAPWLHIATAEEILQSIEACAMVREKIAALPDTYRTVLELRDIEDHTTTQTAETLGISEGAVKVRLHRARRALRHLIETSTDPEAY